MLPNFWSRVNKTSSLASEIPAISKSFSLIIFPALLNFSKSKAAFLAEALSKGQTSTADKNFSATCLLNSVLCLSSSYSVIVVVLISSFSATSCIKETIFSSPAKKSIITLVSKNVILSLQCPSVISLSFGGYFQFQYLKLVLFI